MHKDIVAIGGELNLDNLLFAYQNGVFPWPHEGMELLWFCPKKRFVLEPQNIKINKTLKKAINNTKYNIKFDHDFYGVIEACQNQKRLGQDGTWITENLKKAYIEMFENGYAHSVECYDEGELIGGLYGVSLGKVFFGESMFFKKSNASKFCLIHLCAHLKFWGFVLIDCQAYTKTFYDFGAFFIKKSQFLSVIQTYVEVKPKKFETVFSLKESLAYLQG